MTRDGFVHLRTHSHYSLLSAPARIEDLVAAAAADGQPALGLTDNGALFGAIELYRACTENGIRPIPGMVAYCAARTRHEPTAADNPTHQLTLLPADAVGWDNLKQLSTIGYLEGFYYRPRIDRDALTRHAEGLIALSGDLSGEIPRALMAGDDAHACEVASELRELFGDRFYLELMETGVDAQKRVNPGLLEIHQRMGIPVVATQDVHYLKPDDWVVQDIMLCIRNGKAISDPQRFRMPSRELYFKTAAEMAAAFRDVPQALRATLDIAERCQVEIDFETYHLPLFETGSDETPEQMFDRLCFDGAASRYGEITTSIRERLTYEMGVIKELGFCSYFLITADFIEFARSEGIPVGPGRGSAAGSIVSYALRITDLDPLRYNLIFERFLNASRVSMPDIDIDFCGERRDEVIDYVRQKYGADCVSQIITFGTMASRGVLRDVGRVLEVPLGDVDKIAKKVPQGPGASLHRALETDPELQDIRDESDGNRRLFDLGIKLEGLARHPSVHAAGVVVADRPLREYVPLCKSGDEVTTQWQMTELEEVGLLKMDFLGLKTLTTLHEACRLIEEVHGRKIDLDRLPLDDAPTFELMTRGDTLGVFQLESSGMRELLSRLRPDTFEDVVAVLALYRPGPLGSGMVDMFVRRKHGEEDVVHPHDSLQQILEDTYGVIVYQEQVMQIANVLAGFSMNEADSLRKAMGKKKPEVMAEFKEKFVDGAVAGGHDAKFARELFETIEYFAGYGFNKSHSAAYALITYQTAWLKAHYRTEFLAANMTVESAHSDKLKVFVDDARRSGIKVLPPDVNESSGYFTVAQGSVRYGLGAIKGVGSRLAQEVRGEQRRGGPFTSMESFCERHDPSLLNKTALEALVKAGAFDGVEATRRGALGGIEAALRTSAQIREDRRRGQGSLFDFAAPPPPPTSDAAAANDEWSELERLAMEKEALGFYLSGHPFEKRGRFFARIAGRTSADLQTLEHGETVRIAGMISGVRVNVVKSGKNAGKKMARFNLEDLEGSLPVVAFTRSFERVKDELAEDAIVFLDGQVDRSGEECGLRLESIVPVARVIATEVDGIVVRVAPDLSSDRKLDAIAEVSRRCRGDQRLLLEVRDGKHTFQVRADRRFSVTVSEQLIDELATVVGPDNLSFTRKNGGR